MAQMHVLLMMTMTFGDHFAKSIESDETDEYIAVFQNRPSKVGLKFPKIVFFSTFFQFHLR